METQNETTKRMLAGAKAAVAIAVAKQREVKREKRVKREAVLPQVDTVVTNDANASES